MPAETSESYRCRGEAVDCLAMQRCRSNARRTVLVLVAVLIILVAVVVVVAVVLAY